MGIRPLAINWPPERRAADANGAAQMFSQMRTPAVLPGSMAAARCSTSSSANSSASCFSSACSSPSSPTSESSIGYGAVLILDQDQCVDHSDGSGVDQSEQLFSHLAGEVARSGWKLDHEVVNRAEFVEGSVCHRLSLLASSAVSLGAISIILSVLSFHRDADAL